MLKSQAEDCNNQVIIAEDLFSAIVNAGIIVSMIPDHPGMVQFLNANIIKPGKFASMVDAGRSWKRKHLGKFNRIIIDDVKQESKILQPVINPKLVAEDPQDLIAGRITRRSDDRECSAFRFRGIAKGDLALASLAYKKARVSGLGQELPR